MSPSAIAAGPPATPRAFEIEAVEQAGYHAGMLDGQVDGPAAENGAGENGAGENGPGAGPDPARVRYLRNRLLAAPVFFIPLSDLSVLWSLVPGFGTKETSA